jgi:hypothetical protein
MASVPPQAAPARLTEVLRQAGGAGPSHVFFKTLQASATDEWAELGSKEVRFYELIAPATPSGLLPTRP